MASLFIPGFGYINYTERPSGTPSESYTGETWRVRRIFDVAWTDRWTFMYAMLGFSATNTAIVGGNLVNYVTRVTPPGYITYPVNGQPWLFPVSIESVEPVGIGITDGQDYPTQLATAQYTKARITVGYEALTYTILGDVATQLTQVVAGGQGVYPDESIWNRYITVWRQPTAEYLTLPYGSYKWVEFTNAGNPTPGTPETIGHPKIIPGMELSVTWHMVPVIPTAIKDTIGCVNDDYFNNYPPETLLLTTVDIKPYRMFGFLRYDIIYKFKYFNPLNPNGPNSGVTILTPSMQTYSVTQTGHNFFYRYRLNSVDTELAAAHGVGGYGTGQPPPAYYRLSSDGTIKGINGKSGEPVYPLKPFAPLFTPS